MRKAFCLALIAVMLTACAPAPAVTATPEPPPAATPAPVFDVQQQWGVPNETYVTQTIRAEGERFYYGEPLRSFPPSPDYGRIYLYLSELTTDQYRFSAGRSKVYGLCTADGQIITAPIYAAPKLLPGKPGSYLLYNTEQAGEMVLIENEWGSWVEYTHPAVLISADGRRIEYFDELKPYYYAQLIDFGWEVEIGYLAAKRDGFWGAVDYSGNVVKPFTCASSDEVFADFQAKVDALREQYDTPNQSVALFTKSKVWVPESLAGGSILDLDGNPASLPEGDNGSGRSRFVDNDCFVFATDKYQLSAYTESGELRGTLTVGSPMRAAGNYEGNFLPPSIYYEGNYVEISVGLDYYLTDCDLNVIYHRNYTGSWEDALPHERARFEYGGVFAEHEGVIYSYTLDGTLLTAIEKLPETWLD